jgi:hypothetical protein
VTVSSEDRPGITATLTETLSQYNVSILDVNEKILDVTALADIVLWPVATDFKYHHVEALPDKSIDVCLFNGSIRNSEQEQVARVQAEKRPTSHRGTKTQVAECCMLPEITLTSRRVPEPVDAQGRDRQEPQQALHHRRRAEPADPLNVTELPVDVLQFLELLTIISDSVAL